MNSLSLFSDSINSADSAQVQGQQVKALSSSSNFNNASEREKAEIAQCLPSVSIKGTANDDVVEVSEDFDEIDLSWYKYDYHTGDPAVCVGTYAKYNDGNLDSMWMSLVNCGDYDTFLKVCRAIHRDEEDPEFIFYDYENFCESWYDEGSLSGDTFDRILEFAELDEDEQEAFEAFMDIRCDADVTFEEFREAYCGQWDSEEEYTEQLVDDLGLLDEIPEHLRRFFDMEAYSRELFAYDYEYQDGYVFRVI